MLKKSKYKFWTYSMKNIILAAFLVSTKKTLMVNIVMKMMKPFLFAKFDDDGKFIG